MRLRALLAAVGTVTALAQAAAPAPAFADPDGSLVLSPAPDRMPRAANLIGAGATGFAYQPQTDPGVSTRAVLWQPYDGSAATDLSSVVGSRALPGDLHVVGDDLALATYGSSATTVLFHPATNDGDVTVTVPSGQQLLSPASRALLTADTTADGTGGYRLHLVAADGTDTVLGELAGAPAGQGYAGVDPIADATGALVPYSAADPTYGTAIHLVYVDFAARTVRDVATTMLYGLHRLWLDPTHAAWIQQDGYDATAGSDVHAVHVLDRSGGAPSVVELHRPAAGLWLAVQGDDVLTAPNDSDNPTYAGTLTATSIADGTSSARLPWVGSALLAAPDGSVLVETGRDVTAHSVVRLLPGVSAPALVASLPPLPAWNAGLALAGRRAVTVDTSAFAFGLTERTLATSGPLAETGRRTIATTADANVGQPCNWMTGNRTCAFVVASGSRTAAGADPVVAYDGSAVTASVPVFGGGQVRAMSGRLLVVDTARSGSEVIDASTGTVLVTRLGWTPAVWGDTYWHPVLPASGFPTELDGDNPFTHAHRALTLPRPCDVYGMQAAGRWLGWGCRSDQYYVADTTTGTIYPTGAGGEVKLGDGYFGELVGTTLELVTLPDLTVAPVATFPGTGALPIGWAVDTTGGQTLGYIATDATVHVVPVTATPSPLQILDAVTGDHFTPNGDNQGDSWTPAIDLSAPATWTMTVTTRSGSVVRTLTGTGTSPRPVWDGRTPNGTLAADGTYGWRLTATPLAGGAPVTTTGQVALRARPATATVTAPAVASDTGTTATIPVRWTTSSVPGLRGVDVSYREVSYDSAGHRIYGATHSWLTATIATSATFGRNNSPTAALRGHTYQFLVRPRESWLPDKDAAATATTAMPLDDNDTALGYSAYWSRSASGNRFLTSGHASGHAGASVHATVTGNAVRVVGDRCARCGQIKIYLDGRYLGTVDSYAATTRYRQTLWSRTFTSEQRHTITLVVVATRNRPTVVLDALAVLR